MKKMYQKYIVLKKSSKLIKVEIRLARHLSFASCES